MTRKKAQGTPEGSGARRGASLPTALRAFVLVAIAAQVPAGEVKVAVTRDTWVSVAPGEDEGNNGGATRLKAKSCQELSLLDSDVRPLAGRVIESAELAVTSASSDPLRRVSVSSVSCDWVEGRGSGYARETGAASFRWAETGRRHWTADGGDLSAVILGAGSSLWSWSEATPPDAHGRQSIAVDPRVVALRVAGLSFGFALFDDVGSEYERRGETFVYHSFPNRFVWSREVGDDRAPAWTIVLGVEDRDPPESVTGLHLDAEGDAAGEVHAAWTTPFDRGRAGTIGFLARWLPGEEPPVASFDWAAAEPVPAYRVPLAAEPGRAVTMRLSGFAPGARLVLGVCAVDAAGNRGPVATIAGVASSGWRIPALELRRATTPPSAKPGTSVGPESDAGTTFELARLGASHVAVVDALDVVDLGAGALVPPHPRSYSAENALWSAAARRVDMAAARNEFAGVQIVLSRPLDGLRASFAFDDSSIQARMYAGRGVRAGSMRCVDPLVPWPAERALEEIAKPEASDGFAVAFLDVYVSHDAAPGVHTGKLVLVRGTDRLEIALQVHVWNFTLPDRLSFVPEMNAYELPDPPEERAWYRLAHEHRTCLNRLGYAWNGRAAAGCAPTLVPEGFEWNRFDARFGPLLDGSAFADLPRAGVPVDTFYLPLNENWPVPIEPHFRGGYWADEALDGAYFERFEAAARLMAEHARERRWNATLLEGFLNGKVYFKEKGWSRCSAPWIFDEPTHAQDFWALSCFARAFHAGVDGHAGDARLAFRVDLSRPEWRRDLLDGLVDVSVVGSAIVPYRERVIAKKHEQGEVVLRYATANRVGTSNVMADAWCLDTWCLGADGVIPWQTIGTARSWIEGDALALLYPGQPAGLEEPVASARLKAFRRGQQDVEYLVLWAQALGVSREAIAERVRAALPFASRAPRMSDDDAGELAYPAVDPELLESFRRAVARRLDTLAPPARKQLVDLRPPAREVAGRPVRTTVPRR